MMKQDIQKMFWSQFIVLLAMLLAIIGLIGVSGVSFFQTLHTFEPLNDSTMTIFGFQIGLYVALFITFCVQYGQQVALFINKHFCTGRVMFSIANIEITDNFIALSTFAVMAITDAVTNIIWFTDSVEMPENIISMILIRVIGYGIMIASVFSEEVLGIVLDAFSKAWNQMVELINYNRKYNKVDRTNLQPKNQTRTFDNRPIPINRNQQPHSNNQAQRKPTTSENNNRQNFQRPMSIPVAHQTSKKPNIPTNPAMSRMREIEREKRISDIEKEQRKEASYYSQKMNAEDFEKEIQNYPR